MCRQAGAAPREAESVSGRRLQVLIRIEAIVAVMLVLGCAPQEQPTGDSRGVVDSVASALGRTADAIRDRLSQDFTPTDYDGPPLAELPVYREGDTYTYSSGRSEIITDTIEEQVIWENDLDATLERYRNFVLPTARTRTSRGEVRRSFDVQPDVLWPLIPGARRQFASEVRVQIAGQNGERLFRRDWVCTVDGAERIAVRFGEFESVRVSCDRYSRGKWRERRTWYYVPEVGHYVRRVDTHVQRETRDIELVSIEQAFNGTTKRALYELEQTTLERMPSGKTANWRSSDGTIAVSMTVLNTVKTEAGQFCRTFRQEIVDNGRSRLVPGLACRAWNGRWVRL